MSYTINVAKKDGAVAVSTTREARYDLTRISFYGSVPESLWAWALKHPQQIEEVGGEGEDGYWVYLRSGLIVQHDGVHSIHEWRVRDVFSKFKSVVACTCNECTASDKPKGVVP